MYEKFNFNINSLCGTSVNLKLVRNFKPGSYVWFFEIAFVQEFGVCVFSQN